MPLPRINITAPPRTPAKFGLFTAADVRDTTDPHGAAGFQYQPDACGHAYTTLAACYLSEYNGTIQINDSSVANFSGNYSPPPGTYTVDWGDGDTEDLSGGQFQSASHQYDADGDYTITVTSTASGWTMDPLVITVEDGVPVAAEPFTATYRPSKTVDEGRTLVSSVEFTAYVLHNCKLVGADDPEGYVRRALMLGEQYATAAFLIQTLAEDPDVDPLASDAAFSPVIALGKLDEQLQSQYNGQGVIHLTVVQFTYLVAAGAVLLSGDKAMTALGTPVAVSAAYGGWVPDGGAQNEYMWATGAVVVQRNAPQVSPQVVSAAPATNDYWVLGERPIAVGYECWAGAVAVEYPAGEETP